jgi:hypothetical protein
MVGRLRRRADRVSSNNGTSHYSAETLALFGAAHLASAPTRSLAMCKNYRADKNLACAEGCKRQFALILQSLPAVPARSFAKLRSDKKTDQAPGGRFRASSLQSISRFFGDCACVTRRQIERSQAQGLRRRCPSFAERAQERNKLTGLGRTW